MTVDDFTAELDVPIPGLEKIKPWIPSLNVGAIGDEQILALQVCYNNEYCMRSCIQVR